MSDLLPATVHLKAITPRSLLVDAAVEEIQIPSVEGLIGVLPGHRPLVTALGHGELSYRMGLESETFAVRGGYAEIEPDRVLVFTDLDKEP
jgi:F-type H+-transporting ATPase subunit epsilon